MTNAEADQLLTDLEKALSSGAMTVGGALARAFLYGARFVEQAEAARKEDASEARNRAMPPEDHRD